MSSVTVFAMAVSDLPLADPVVLASNALQAAYFRGALADQRALLRAEIARQNRTLGSMSTKSDALAISRLRREIRGNEVECRDLDRMISALDQRFAEAWASRP